MKKWITKVGGICLSLPKGLCSLWVKLNGHSKIIIQTNKTQKYGAPKWVVDVWKEETKNVRHDNLTMAIVIVYTHLPNNVRRNKSIFGLWTCKQMRLRPKSLTRNL